MKLPGHRWAVSEHMTLNGSDFRPDAVPAILRATLANGSLYGWDLVNVAARSTVAVAGRGRA